MQGVIVGAGLLSFEGLFTVSFVRQRPISGSKNSGGVHCGVGVSEGAKVAVLVFDGRMTGGIEVAVNVEVAVAVKVPVGEGVSEARTDAV